MLARFKIAGRLGLCPPLFTLPTLPCADDGRGIAAGTLDFASSLSSDAKDFTLLGAVLVDAGVAAAFGSFAEGFFATVVVFTAGFDVGALAGTFFFAAAFLGSGFTAAFFFFVAGTSSSASVLFIKLVDYYFVDDDS